MVSLNIKKWLELTFRLDKVTIASYKDLMIIKAEEFTKRTFYLFHHNKEKELQKLFSTVLKKRKNQAIFMKDIYFA